MNDLLSLYGTDPELESDGVWCTDFKGGIEVKIRSSQSDEYKAASAAVVKRNQKYERMGQETPEAVVQKNLRELASAAVAAWRVRTKGKDGAPDTVSDVIALEKQELACDDAGKAVAFTDKRLWTFRANVIARANDTTRFAIAADEADAGNSAAPSAPVSNSVATESA